MRDHGFRIDCRLDNGHEDVGDETHKPVTLEDTFPLWPTIWTNFLYYDVMTFVKITNVFYKTLIRSHKGLISMDFVSQRSALITCLTWCQEMSLDFRWKLIDRKYSLCIMIRRFDTCVALKSSNSYLMPELQCQDQTELYMRLYTEVWIWRCPIQATYKFKRGRGQYVTWPCSFCVYLYIYISIYIFSMWNLCSRWNCI